MATEAGLAASRRRVQGPRRTAWGGRASALLSSSRGRAVLSVVAVGVAWEVGARLFLKNSLFFVPLSVIFSEAADLWSTGVLWRHIVTSFEEFAVGFAISAVAGIFLGMVMAASKLARDVLDPWVSALYATPIIALGPLLILMFGIDAASKIAIIILLVVFPILINTFAGLSTADRNLLEAARAFGAGELQLFTQVRIPSAIPFIVAGLRLGVGRALIGVVVGELIGARAGLGYLITVSAQTFDTAGVFVGVLILAVSGLVAGELLKALERKLAPWRVHDGND
jgi:ABC-type nitrate/sulfonate/bicarbonate transport system permease component